jgi:hypothetical protein
MPAPMSKPDAFTPEELRQRVAALTPEERREAARQEAERVESGHPQC